MPSTAKTTSSTFQETDLLRNSLAVSIYEILLKAELATIAKGLKYRGMTGATLRERYNKTLPYGSKELDLVVFTSRVNDLYKEGLLVCLGQVRENGKRAQQLWRTTTNAETRAMEKVGALGKKRIATSPKMIRSILPFYTTPQGRILRRELASNPATRVSVKYWDAQINEVVFQGIKSLGIKRLMQLKDSPHIFRKEALQKYVLHHVKEACSVSDKAVELCVKARTTSGIERRLQVFSKRKWG